MGQFENLCKSLARKVPDPFRMGIKDVSLAFGVCYDTARRWSKQRDFPRPFMAGGRPRWQLTDLVWWALRTNQDKLINIHVKFPRPE